MDYESLLELLKERRSIRRFKRDPVPDEYIDKIIEAARWAPSGLNSQPWEFVIVKDQGLKDKMVQLLDEGRNQRRRMESTRESSQFKEKPRALKETGDFSYAPVFVLLFGDRRTTVGLPLAVQYDQHRLQIIFISSLANAFLYMHLAATTLGLASQWVSQVQMPFIHCLLKDLLGIPNELEIYDMMAVGYPALKSRPKLMRKKEDMIHYDFCGKHNFRTDEEVNEFIRKTRAWVDATHRRSVKS